MEAVILPRLWLPVLAALLAACAAPDTQTETGAVPAPLPADTLQPDVAPPLNVLNARGKPVQPLRGLKRPLLVNFWATWCGPCREELPALAQAHTSGTVDVLLVNLSERPDKVQPYLQKVGAADVPTVYAYESDLAGWPLPGVPASFLVSPEGKLLERRFGPLAAGDPLLGK